MIKSQKIANLYQYFCENKLSHVFLIETNDEKQCLEDVTNLIKRIMCPESFKEECQACSICNLLNINGFPEHTLIEANGQVIKKDTILELLRKLSYKPVFSDYKTYIILDCDRMNVNSANILLKTIEEPAEKTIGFLITKQKEMVISTIKSRCQIINVIYGEKEDIKWQKYAEIFNVHMELISGNLPLIYDSIYQLGLNSRVDLENYFTYIFNLTINKNTLNNDLSKNRKILAIAKKSIEMTKNNVNIEMCLDYFTIEMRRLNE